MTVAVRLALLSLIVALVWTAGCSSLETRIALVGGERFAPLPADAPVEVLLDPSFPPAERSTLGELQIADSVPDAKYVAIGRAFREVDSPLELVVGLRVRQTKELDAEEAMRVSQREARRLGGNVVVLRHQQPYDILRRESTLPRDED